MWSLLFPNDLWSLIISLFFTLYVTYFVNKLILDPMRADIEKIHVRLTDIDNRLHQLTLNQFALEKKLTRMQQTPFI